MATAEGLRPIEEIAAGDLVMAWDEQTGRVETRPVTNLIRPEPKLVWKLVAQDSGGEIEVFHATDDHPWHVAGVGWVETKLLSRGQKITSADGKGVSVVEVGPTDRVERTYNLTVAGLHTFLIGEHGIVVHNACQFLDKIGDLRATETIARGRGIRVVNRLVNQYGGRADQWRKMKGFGTDPQTGRTAEYHWYQNSSLGRFEGKFKAWAD